MMTGCSVGSTSAIPGDARRPYDDVKKTRRVSECALVQLCTYGFIDLWASMVEVNQELEAELHYYS